jgi:hypothetical protein
MSKFPLQVKFHPLIQFLDVKKWIYEFKFKVCISDNFLHQSDQFLERR